VTVVATCWSSRHTAGRNGADRNVGQRRAVDTYTIGGPGCCV
jgi:hypothetical protein